MRKSIVIVGGGTGGTIMANRLRKRLAPDDVSLTVIDGDNQHLYQPGLLFVPFGIHTPDEIVRPRRQQIHDGIDVIAGTVKQLDVESRTVTLEEGNRLYYDVLLIASGANLLFDEPEGFTGPGWMENVFTFYTLEGATALAQKLAQFEGGKLVISICDMPIKCPVAPLEFAFLADWYFTSRGIRDKVDITFVTPLDGAFTRKIASETLQRLLADKNITTVAEFCTSEIDGNGGLLKSYCGREVPFDLLVATPLHEGPAFVGDVPGLGDALNFVQTDNHTLQSALKDNIFAIGDVTSLPTSKAGSVTHFEAEILEQNICDFLAGKPLAHQYDGHANCFIETGFGKAMLIDFNYEQEPVPGRFPFAGSPISLLKESKFNHLGKLMFQKIYWNVLLPGHPMPFIGADMPLSGKQVTQPTEPSTTEEGPDSDEPENLRRCDR